MHLVQVKSAAEQLPDAERIMVVGCSGSGKSTLSFQLAKRLGLRHISMDRDAYWLPGWVMRDKHEVSRLVDALVAEPRWVFDGNGISTMPARLRRSKLVLWLRPPRRVSVFGAIRRIFRSYGKVRPDMAPGCPERIDLHFFAYIWNFEKNSVPGIIRMIEENGHGIPVCILKSHGQVNELLALLERDY